MTNILGTLNLLEAIKTINLQAFINTGTSSEYGYKQLPMKETDLLTPNSFYASSKASISLFCQVFAQQFNQPIITLRPFSIYGDWEEPTRFIPTVITSCLKNKSIRLVSDNQRRDFLYVKDMTRAFLLAGLSSNCNGEIINVCSGKQYLITKTAQKIIKLIGNPVKIKKQAYPSRRWDTNYWLGNRQKAKKLLNWEPKYSLEAGLIKSINWHKTITKDGPL